MHRPLLATIRVISTAVIAGIAAWVSYWHMQDVAVRFGETQVSAYLLPISVDGLIVVASVSLVELAGRIRTVSEAKAQAAATPAPATVAAPAPAYNAVPSVAPAPAPVAIPAAVAAPVAAPDQDELDALEEEFADVAAPLSAGGDSHGPVRTPRSAPVSPAVGPVPSARSATRAAAAVSAPPRTMVTESTAPRPRRPASETAQLADAIEAMQPGIREDELASRLNISVSRLRQVRREEAARRASLTA
jgi:hypothetical protein